MNDSLCRQLDVASMQASLDKVNKNLAQVNMAVDKLASRCEQKVVGNTESFCEITRELRAVLGDLKSYAEQFQHTGTSLANAVRFQLTEQAQQNEKFTMAAESMAERLGFLEYSMMNGMEASQPNHFATMHVPNLIPQSFLSPKYMTETSLNGTQFRNSHLIQNQPKPPLFFRDTNNTIRQKCTALAQPSGSRPIKRGLRVPHIAIKDVSKQMNGSTKDGGEGDAASQPNCLQGSDQNSMFGGESKELISPGDQRTSSGLLYNSVQMPSAKDGIHHSPAAMLANSNCESRDFDGFNIEDGVPVVNCREPTSHNDVKRTPVQVSIIPLFSNKNKNQRFKGAIHTDPHKKHLYLYRCDTENEDELNMAIESTIAIRGPNNTIGLRSLANCKTKIH